MADLRTPTTAARKAVADRLDRQGMRATARELHLDRATLARIVAGGAVSARTLVALERIAPRVREASEFRGSAVVRPLPAKLGPYVWDLEAIRGARDQQIRGVFDLPVRLAEAMRTDDALFNAYHGRIAPQSAIEARLVAAKGARGAAVARKAAASVFVARSVLAGIHGTLANHGIAIGHVEHEPAPDGTRVDVRLMEWPLEYVRWIPHDGRLVTATLGGVTVPIVHGDGQWIIFRKFYAAPWTQDACVLPAALVWAAHGNGIRDWAQASRAHGQSKIVGELPEGTALQAEDGALTQEAQLFIGMIQDLVSGEGGAGIRPAGSKTDFIANGSTAWQVFAELAANREKAAARIYLGTDAILGSMGGAPGVDISLLFGVATTKVQGDFSALEQGLRTGLYEPWCAINEGSSLYAPALVYQMPDPDAEQKAAQRVQRRTDLLDTIDRYKASGLVLTQAVVDALARELGVDSIPQLAPLAAPTAPATALP